MTDIKRDYESGMHHREFTSVESSTSLILKEVWKFSHSIIP